MVAWRVESFRGLAAFTDWDSKHAGSHTSSGGDTISTTLAGRNGGYGCRLTDDGRDITAVFDATATAYCGFASAVGGLAGSGTAMVVFLDTTTTHVRFLVSSAGEVIIQRNTTEVARSAAGVVVAGQTAYWEFKVTIADASGVAEVLKNGVVVVTFSGDTRNAGNASTNSVVLTGWANAVNTDIADLYYGATGGYWGDGTVEWLPPSAAGNSTQFSRGGSDSGANWSQVDEAAPNDDTDYVFSGVVGDKDTYAVTNLTATSGQVQGVQYVARLRKDDAGARSASIVGRLTLTEVDSSSLALGTSYGYLVDPRTTKPTGGAWGIPDVNAMEMGLKVAA